MSAENSRASRRNPEDGRKVWAERYPGGDVQIEVGHMENVEELYLLGGEADALREILNELEEMAEKDRGESDGGQ